MALPLGRQARGADLLLPLLWLAVLGLFVAGCVLPAISIQAWFIRTAEVSVSHAVLALFEEGHTGLALVIAVFAGAVPLAKMAALALLWGHPDPASPRFRRVVTISASLSKWAMLDVFVLALVVFAVQGQGLASAAVLPGAYCFAGAALLSMVLTFRVQRLVAGLPVRQGKGHVQGDADGEGEEGDR